MRYGDERFQALVAVIEINDYYKRHDAFAVWMDKLGWQ